MFLRERLRKGSDSAIMNSKDMGAFQNPLNTHVNPKMDMQKIVTLDGCGVCADPRDHFGKNATLNNSQV